QRSDQLARLGLTEWEWVVAAERDALSPQEANQSTQRVGIVNERIDEETPQIRARVERIVPGTQVGPSVKAHLDPADGASEGAAAVSEPESQSRQPLQHAAEDQ